MESHLRFLIIAVSKSLLRFWKLIPKTSWRMNSQEWRSSSSQPNIDPLALYHPPLVIFQEQSLAAKWTHKKKKTDEKFRALHFNQVDSWISFSIFLKIIYYMSLFGNRGINKMILVKFSKYGDQLYGSPVPEITEVGIHSFIQQTFIEVLLCSKCSAFSWDATGN